MLSNVAELVRGTARGGASGSGCGAVLEHLFKISLIRIRK